MKYFHTAIAAVPLFFCSVVVSASNSVDEAVDQLEILQLNSQTQPSEQLEILKSPSEDQIVVGPKEIRHRSSTSAEYQQPFTVTNPSNLPELSHKSPTTITAVFSVSEKIRKADKISHPMLSHSHHKSFATLKHQQASSSRFTSPRSSPIISQLNTLDQLFASQFPRSPSPANLLPGHLSVLKAHCRHLASELGPLNQKSLNCAFRYHELIRFLQLLTKYDTTVIANHRDHASFCSALVSNLKRLQNLVFSAFNNYSEILSSSQSPVMAAALAPFSKEIKALESAIDTIDLDLLFYCHFDSTDNHSINNARETIATFLHLAFI